MHLNLTSSELSGLWTTYMNDSMSLAILNYYSRVNQDAEIQPIIDSALSTSKDHLNKIQIFFNKDNYPLPYGFSEQDADPEAQRLFSDLFSLIYINEMSRLALHSYSLLLANAARSDIRQFFSDAINQTIQLYNTSILIMLNKGVYRRPPVIPTYKESNIVKSTDYIKGFFGERRPLNAVELTEIYFNIQRNALIKAMLIGFSQVANNEKVKQHMIKGKEIAAKHIEILNSVLNEDDLFSSLTWDIEITRTTDKTFSDRLMLFHINILSALGAGYYGLSSSMSMRRDLGVLYKRLIAESQKYAKNGAKIIINNNWFEEPPQAPDRDKLTNF